MSSTRERRRAIPWTALAVTTGIALRTAVLRARANRLTVVPRATEQIPAEVRNDWYLLLAPGARMTGSQFADAVGHACRGGLKALDLVPDTLPAADALDLLADVDPAAYPKTGRTPGHALIVRRDVAVLAGLTGTRTVAADPVEFLRTARRVRDCAVSGVGLAVLPGLTPATGDPAWRAARLRAVGSPEALGLAWPAAVAGAVAAAAMRSPRAGTPAALLLWLRPRLVFAGRRSPLRPPDARDPAALAARPVRAALAWRRSVAERHRESPATPPPRDIAALRRHYAEAVSAGLDRFFEPRRDDCPWCGSPALRRELRVRDLIQGKPGRFTLDRCLGCGHVFQNPRLSLAGLEYYYGDFYDGINVFGEGATGLAPMHEGFRGRAELPRHHTTPKTWLDVGTGPGHFCAHARTLWPDTVFDGLDMSESVLQGVRNGWLDTAHRGQFPELAASLAGRYDVISMSHYLEHTIDPRAELRAAATALAPGGHLLIEVPDPQSPLRLIFRSRWVCWLQPQHLHFLPPGNLRRALEEHGFTVVADEHGPAHTGGEFVIALVMTVNALAPDPTLPWAGPPTPLRRLRRAAVQAASAPFYIPAVALEVASGWIVKRTGLSNAYRVLARRNDA
jgi:SAM-dependent methyltransferase